jgi:hypothetical protein
MTRTAVWKKGDWEVRGYTYKEQPMVAEGYRFQFELNGIVMCEFTGVPDYQKNVFRMRGIIIHRSWYLPKTRELPFGWENKEFEIEIS